MCEVVHTASCVPRKNRCYLSRRRTPSPSRRCGDIEGVVVRVRVRPVPNMHAFTALGANDEETEDAQLPPPEQPLLIRFTVDQLAELIERHLDYVDATGRSVHPRHSFVRHYHVRDDNVLPLVVAVATPRFCSSRSYRLDRGKPRSYP